MALLPLYWSLDEVSLLIAWCTCRFVPCSVGADHCRLRRVGWERCGHGLTSRPRESASEAFLNELLQLFQYAPRSAHSLLAGTVPLRLCAVWFASRVPTWRLPVSGHAAGLATADLGIVDGDGDRVVHEEVRWSSGSGPGRKRIRPNRKKPFTSRG